jgi:tetratricopeptide (TPR) repeat protein
LSLGGIGTSASGLVLAFSPLLKRPDSTLQPGNQPLPEGSILALSQSNGVIRLIDPETGRALAELTDPHQHSVHTMNFSSDGSKLLTTVQEERGMIHIWDLRTLRAELTELGLDWDWPSLPAGPSTNAVPLAVQVDLGAGLAAALSPEGSAQRDIDHFRAAHAANPNNVVACNGLAWVLATAPEKLRRMDEALALAEKAVESAPGNALFTNTLGVVYYRLGRFKEAVECLEPNLSRQEDSGLAFDLYFLAMSHYMLGDVSRARELLTWANRWTELDTHKEKISFDQLAELASFRQEAEQLIGK